MSISKKPILNFSGGEASPKLKGRPDVVPYFTCGETLENVLVSNYGGVIRTPGTRLVARTKFVDKQCKLVPFIFSADLLEEGDE